MEEITQLGVENLEWHYHASDLKQLKSIHNKFGTIPLKTYPCLIYSNIKFIIDILMNMKGYSTIKF